MIHIANSSVAFESTAINYSEGHGIYLNTDGDISSCEGVTFEGNMKSDVFNDSGSPDAACNLI
jgi:hypothetical protein